MTVPTKPAAERRARDIMTRSVLTVRPEWPIEQLADFLVRNSISGAPVTSAAGDLLGVVSLTDIARASTLSEEDLSSRQRHEFYSHLLDEPGPTGDPRSLDPGEHSQLKVQEIMTPVIVDVDEDATLKEVAGRMIHSRVHRLFVTGGGKILGVITTLDMLKAIRDG